MFGAIWYYNAIEKVTECWREACKNHTGCSGHSYFSCNKSSRDYNFLNDFCRISTGSTTSYSFGIYNDALQSGIVGETDFPKKLIRCLRWGLQNLRFAVFYMAWIMIIVHVIRSVTGSLSPVQVYFVVLFASMYFFFPQFSFILFFVALCIL
ncbi:hypothetical protein WN944_025084 [Citrus x changshan-huyou]|uniref:Uncharacterized protein n=1 Tax=Citrus x changshan-huyou TaxID=2935761 RepID=A0AAP0LP65_9ROSI